MPVTCRYHRQSLHETQRWLDLGFKVFSIVLRD